MSKKKPKTRIEKATTHHDFAHLSASPSIVIKSAASDSSSVEPQKATAHSPLETFVKSDLRLSLILILVFVVAISALGLLVYQTHLLTPLLSRFGLVY